MTNTQLWLKGAMDGYPYHSLRHIYVKHDFLP